MAEEGQGAQDRERAEQAQEGVGPGFLAVIDVRGGASREQGCQQPGPGAADGAAQEEHRTDAQGPEQHGWQPQRRLVVAERTAGEPDDGVVEGRVGLVRRLGAPEIAQRLPRPPPGEGLVGPERFAAEIDQPQDQRKGQHGRKRHGRAAAGRGSGQRRPQV
jgi:hypothetical protein